MPSHIPAGFAAVVPYLHIQDPKGFFDFAREGLGATVRAEHYDDGRLVHGEIELLGCIIELGQPSDPSSTTNIALHVFVRDPDAAYQRAIEAGATSVYEVRDHPYGERSGGVADRWGNQWYFACVTDHEARNTQS